MLTVALIWGIVAFAGFCVGLIPCLGWLNWINIPFGIGGVAVGILAMVRANADRQAPGPAIAGLVLSSIAVGLGLVRLLLGGGFL